MNYRMRRAAAATVGWAVALAPGAPLAASIVYEVNATYLVQSVEENYFNECAGGPSQPNCGDLQGLDMAVGNFLIATFRFGLDDSAPAFAPQAVGDLRLSLYDGATFLGSSTRAQPAFELLAFDNLDTSADPDLPDFGTIDALVAGYEIDIGAADDERGIFLLSGDATWFETVAAMPDAGTLEAGVLPAKSAFDFETAVVFETSGNLVYEQDIGGFLASVDIRAVGTNDGSSPDNPLLPVLPVDPDDPGFVFEVPPADVIAGVPIWIDPEIAIGYTYTVANAEIGAITAPDATMIPDADGYTLTIDGIAYSLLPGATLDLQALGLSGITSFVLTGIDPALGLDPLDEMAFMLGITPINFGGTDPIVFTQTPITTPVPVPPAGLMALGGLALLAGLRRRRA